jgi:PAS domain S-box-containing protein
MKSPLRVLVVEDSKDDVELLVRAIERGEYDVVCEQVETADEMEAALDRAVWDLVVSDYSLPTFSGPEALRLVKERGHDIPFIIVSGTIGEAAAVNALKAGAHDFLPKGQLARLLPAIDRELRDVAQRRARLRAQEALHQSEERHRSLVERAVFGIYRATAVGRFLTVNPALAIMLGYDSPDELLAIGMPSLFDDETSYEELRDRVSGRTQFTGEQAVWRSKAGTSVRVRLSGRVIDLPDIDVPVFEVIVEDITERHHLEEQLRQAQKMEAIGRLAGGIAHDFNNLLTAIMGYSQLLLDRVRHEPDLVADLNEIKKAGERAASLTRQLLAFSRKQVLEPQILDLNNLVTEVSKMLRRIIGEDVRFEAHLSPDLGHIKADPGQIEQVLINLAVNARDAMPRGGALTIRTANALLPSEFEGAQKGMYVSLSVADNGSGMTPEVRARIFEPFFTTKGPEKGTGLGLSTVYGIVTQSNGHIAVDTAPGRGTVLTVYLPVIHEAIAPVAFPTALATSGTETILLVDDEAGVRDLGKRVLTAQGYRVLEAADTTTALTIARNHPGVIHLLVCDVVLPGMNGPDLAQWIVSSRPGMQVLYISGYPNLVTDLGAISPRTAFLQKPFTPDQLVRKVRQRLDVGLMTETRSG